MRKAALLVVVVLLQVGFALTRAYSVEPVKQEWSGFTDTIFPYDRVSQIVTCCWDELDSTVGAYVELFVGSRGASPSNPYKVDVYEVDGSSEPIAWHNGKAAQRDHTWLKLPLTVETGYEFTKGKQYEFRFTEERGTHYYFLDPKRVKGWPATSVV